MIVSQLLGAHYTCLSYSRAQRDRTDGKEILENGLSHFLTVSVLIEESIDGRDQLDKGQLIVRLKTMNSTG
ncbi:MAG: hypothetical protein GTN81_16500 [Proteobacteria bacterium]|nr:hypothetical protein [Pseudomonadota bacterium]